MTPIDEEENELDDIELDDDEANAIVYMLCDIARNMLSLTEEEIKKLDELQASIYQEGQEEVK